MRDNPEGVELYLAVDDCRHCKKNSPSILFCIDKRTKKAVTAEAKPEHPTVGEVGEVPLKKPKESDKRENCERDFVFS